MKIAGKCGVVQKGWNRTQMIPKEKETEGQLLGFGTFTWR